MGTLWVHSTVPWLWSVGGVQATGTIVLLPAQRTCLAAAHTLQPLLTLSKDTWTSGIWVCSSQQSWYISFSVALGSVRSLGEATLSRTRRKPPPSPGSCFVIFLVEAVVGIDAEGFVGVFGEAVGLAMVMFGFLLVLTVVE